MLVMVQEDRRRTIRQALRRRVTKGSRATWSTELLPLLNLEPVRARLVARPNADAASVVDGVLEEAIGKLEDPTYRDLLRIVLQLDPETWERPLSERRAAAAARFARDGREISPGTVRQYHEPRALDQLTSILASEVLEARSASLQPATDEIVRWHPAVHEEVAGERLLLIRATFDSYQRSVVLEPLTRSMDRAGVLSWSVFELLGGVDLLIRAWVDADSWRKLPEELQGSLVGARLRMFDSFEVRRSISDWSWPFAPKPDDVSHLAQQLGSGARGPSGELLHQLEARGLATRARPPKGVRFLVTVRNDEVVGIDRGALEACRRVIGDCLRRHDIAAARVLEGAGFATFVIEGVVSPSAFSTLRDFLEELGGQSTWGRFQIATWICGSDEPIVDHEQLPEGQSKAIFLDAMQALEEGENETVEIKAGITRKSAVNAHHAVEPDWRPIARTIASMLNGVGGTLLIGATDDPRLVERGDAWPRVGPWAICGIDEQMPKGWDHYQSRLRAAISRYVEPDASALISVERDEILSQTVCVIHIPGRSRRWHWFKDGKTASTFLVREGVRTRELSGAAADEYRASVGQEPETSALGALK